MDGDLSGSRVVLRVTSRAGTDPPRATAPLSPPTTGISIGAGSPAAFYCNRDPQVDAAHGTLERTAGHGVWVFVDHSARGSMVNGRARVHRDAVVVRSGDKLTLGDTEIEIAIVPASAAENAGRKVHTNASKQRAISSTETATTTGVNMTRRWSMPKQTVPPIDTSFPQSDPMNQPPAFKRATSASSADPAAVTPQYINSPIPGSNWRRKRNSIATATVRTPLIVMNNSKHSGKVIPSPPVAGMGQPFVFPRGRTLVSPASTTTSSEATSIYSPGPDSDGDRQYFQPLYVHTASDQTLTPPPPLSPPQASPIPLEYSSSPVASPFMRRIQDQRNAVVKQGKLHAPNDAVVLGAGPPKSRRDDLRIQVSKKMAAAVEEKRSRRGDEIEQQPRPRRSPVVDTLSRIQQRHLEFTPPASPVPHRDIVNQQQSLLAILKGKYKEEQLLKQQQEEWMRQQSDGSSSRSDGRGTPPLSPIKTPKSSRSTFSSDDSSGSDSPVSATDLSELIPDRLPELLRTNSTGQSWRQPSPRVTAALLASRAARANKPRGHFGRQNIDEKRPNDDGGDALLAKSDADDHSETSSKLEEFAGLRARTRSSSTSSSDSVSVSSSVTTEVTCHRRVTRSLSVASSIDSNASDASAISPARGSPDGDLADVGFFVGYDDDTDEEDDATTFRYYGEGSVTRSRGDSAPLVGSATMKRSASYDSSPSSSQSTSPSQATPPSSGLFTVDALKSPRKLIHEDKRRPSHRGRNYLERKKHQDELQPEASDIVPSLRPARKPDPAKHSKDTAAMGNNSTHDNLKSASRSTRRRSAPPCTMTLGLPLTKLTLSINPSNLDSENQLEEDPETTIGHTKHALPPPPPPSTKKPSRDARPSFRRRSAFALA